MIKHFLIGLLSGFLTGVSSGMGELSYSPGIIFGLIIGYHFLKYLNHKKILLKNFLFIVITMQAYKTAVFLAILIIGPNEGNQIISYSIAGMTGAAIMLAGFYFLIYHLRLIFLPFLILLGGLLGNAGLLGANLLSSLNVPYSTNTSNAYLFFSLFLIWQTGMAVGIGWTVEKSKKPEIIEEVVLPDNQNK